MRSFLDYIYTLYKKIHFHEKNVKVEYTFIEREIIYKMWVTWLRNIFIAGVIFYNITATSCLFCTVPLEGLRSQNQFEEMRSSYIRELIKAIGLRQKGVVPSSQRFYQLTKLLDSLHDVNIFGLQVIGENSREFLVFVGVLLLWRGTMTKAAYI